MNDGFAQEFLSVEAPALPRWARWRNEIFGFTYEPAVLAINKRLLGDLPVPRSRAELLSLVRNNPGLFRGRIGTFDIEKVGAGYLTWAHDRQQSGSYGRMLEVFGSHQARRFPSSAAMLKALSNDELVVAYNLLGSYAQAWAEEHPEVLVINPEDYTTLDHAYRIHPQTGAPCAPGGAVSGLPAFGKGTKIAGRPLRVLSRARTAEGLPDSKQPAPAQRQSIPANPP